MAVNSPIVLLIAWFIGVAIWSRLQFGDTLFDRSPLAAIFADAVLIGLTLRALPLAWAAVPLALFAGHLAIRLYRYFRRFGTRSGEIFWLRTPQGVAVYCEYFAPPGVKPNKAIVIAHGISASAHDRLIHAIAGWLLNAGYAVFLFDEPGHCHSGGVLNLDSEYGLRAVLDEARRRGFSKVGVLGLSLGALLGLRVASETNGFGALVFVSGFGDHAKMMKKAWAYTNPIGRAFMRFWGVRIAPVFDLPDPAVAAAKVRIPVLVVHSINDGIAPPRGHPAALRRVQRAEEHDHIRQQRPRRATRPAPSRRLPRLPPLLPLFPHLTHPR